MSFLFENFFHLSLSFDSLPTPSPSIKKNGPAPFIGASVRLRDARRVVPSERDDDDGGEATAAAARGDGGDNNNVGSSSFLAPRPRLRGAQVFSRLLLVGGPVARREEARDADDERILVVESRGRARSGEKKRERKRKEREREREKKKKPR